MDNQQKKEHPPPPRKQKQKQKQKQKTKQRKMKMIGKPMKHILAPTGKQWKIKSESIRKQINSIR